MNVSNYNMIIFIIFIITCDIVVYSNKKIIIEKINKVFSVLSGYSEDSEDDDDENNKIISEKHFNILFTTGNVGVVFLLIMYFLNRTYINDFIINNIVKSKE